VKRAHPPTQVIEPTVIAALNMNYPGSKLTVHVLDDGNRAEVYKLARRLDFQCRWVGIGQHHCVGQDASCLLQLCGLAVGACAAGHLSPRSCA
jgi:hypothetical protein